MRIVFFLRPLPEVREYRIMPSHACSTFDASERFLTFDTITSPLSPSSNSNPVLHSQHKQLLSVLRASGHAYSHGGSLHLLSVLAEIGEHGVLEILIRLFPRQLPLHGRGIRGSLRR